MGVGSLEYCQGGLCMRSYGAGGALGEGGEGLVEGLCICFRLLPGALGRVWYTNVAGGALGEGEEVGRIFGARV